MFDFLTTREAEGTQLIMELFKNIEWAKPGAVKSTLATQ